MGKNKEEEIKMRQQNRPRMTFRERIYRFMYGRNGTDALCKALLVLYLILIVANLFLPYPYSFAMSIAEFVLGAYIIFRIMSRNLYKRGRENQWYLRQKNRIKGFFALKKARHRDRKTHIFRKCKHCRKTLRLPRIKGRHTVRCPLCGARFDIKV